MRGVAATLGAAFGVPAWFGELDPRGPGARGTFVETQYLARFDASGALVSVRSLPPNVSGGRWRPTPPGVGGPAK